MKRIALVVAAIICMSGCAQQNVKEALENISHDCERHYTFSASTGGVGGVGGSITVAGTADCKPSGVVPPVVVPVQPQP